MALADHYAEADVLDTLSWVGMSLEARLAKLASLYLDRENDMRSAHRKYKGPTKGTVRFFVKSVFVPPRGEGALTIDGVLEAISTQRACREEREKHPTWTWERDSIRERRNAVARHLYTIWGEVSWRTNKKEKKAPNCVSITTIAEVRLIVDGGDYGVQPRIYMRHIESGEAKIVVLEGGTLKSVTTALTRLAPKQALRAAFAGTPMRLDFKSESFEIEGELYPWRKVQRIYPERKAHKTWADPDKKKKKD